MHTVLLTILAPAWAQTSPAHAPVVIDRVEVVVGTRVITASDLRLSIALDSRDPSPVPVLQGAAPDPLQRLIDRTILRGLAGQVRVYQPDEADVRARVDALRSSWSSLSDYQRFLRSHGLDEERLQRRMKERMLVERYIRRNLAAPAQGERRVGLAQYIEWMAGLRASVRVRRIRAGADEL